MNLTKTCSKCGIEKPITDFYKRTNSKDGVQQQCKDCSKIYGAEWYKKNKESIDEKHRKYRIKHLEHIRHQQRLYYSRPDVKAHRIQYAKENAEHIREYQRKYRIKNRIYLRAKENEYYHKNKGKHKTWNKKWRDSHKEQIKVSSKRYREENRQKINGSRLERLHSDPLFRLKEQYRNRVHLALKAKKHSKNSKTAEMLGCDLYFFKDYMLSTWEKRYGKAWNGESYHIDHIVPLMSAHTENEVKKLFHYTNLQLLTPEDNVKKRGLDKIKYAH